MLSGRFTRIATTFAGLVAATIAFGMSGQASAGTVCTRGDANAMLQAQPVATQVMLPRGQDHPGLLVALQDCQYRLFFDGQTFTFHESDYFVGGSTNYVDYKASGISRSAAINEMKQETTRVWLAPKNPDGTIGAFVEQALTYTAYKDVTSPTFGVLVYQQRAFIAHLPAGKYVSYFLDTLPGEPDISATVNLVVLPG